jgi:hypothetical protein
MLDSEQRLKMFDVGKQRVRHWQNLTAAERGGWLARPTGMRWRDAPQPPACYKFPPTKIAKETKMRDASMTPGPRWFRVHQNALIIISLRYRVSFFFHNTPQCDTAEAASKNNVTNSTQGESTHQRIKPWCQIEKFAVISTLVPLGLQAQPFSFGALLHHGRPQRGRV